MKYRTPGLRAAACSLLWLLGACSADTSAPKKSPPPAAPEAASMPGARCATLGEPGWSGNSRQLYETGECLRKLAYADWQQASAEAAHIANWGVRRGSLRELTVSLARYESAAALEADLGARGLLGGPGDPDFIEFVAEDWQPITVGDWLAKAGNQYWFDGETGTYPNNHDYLLESLAALFGDGLAGAEFRETAPPYDSDDPYQLHATLGERSWNREAGNHGDWYDVGAVLALLNDMAAELGHAERAMPLFTGDQTLIVIVAPGEALVRAAADGLIDPADAREGMERGKTFEDAWRQKYQVR